MIPQTHVEVAEVLCHLAGRTNAPSSMGSQLDRLAMQSEAKRHGPGWVTHSKPSRPAPKDPEGPILRDGAVFRLIGEVSRIRGNLDPAHHETLLRVCVAFRTPVGAVVLETLRTYHEALQTLSAADVERAKARADKVGRSRPGVLDDETGEWIGKSPCVDDKGRDIVACACSACKWERSYAKACIEYRAPHGVAAIAKRYNLEELEAKLLYGDCFLVLSEHVDAFNRQKKAS